MHAFFMQWHRIYNSLEDGINAVPEKRTAVVLVNGKRICITRVGDEFFGFDTKCPHQGASMVNAQCNEYQQIVCPLHRFKYNLNNGQGDEGFYLKTYPVKVEQGGVYIGVKKKPWYLPD